MEGRRESLSSPSVLRNDPLYFWERKGTSQEAAKLGQGHHPRCKDLLTMSKGTLWRTPVPCALASVLAFLLDCFHRDMQEAGA
jgi:hypothetical protein